ncbi:ROK family transcriptional regulator [Pelagibacterium lentulum]|uniref:Sugar kinase n=1 Tax=Pelagibacterium lentulum TaxID=2029865 RepID=A0A916RLV9_9HYPH|nr:ROK family transcriptional regulator [Pelagibacterium lentulum]GGA62145.1 sugar kinase [Pelagibacterium lentulum]
MRKNGGQLLALLRDNGAMSRADLARAIGVSAPALTKIASSQLERGLIAEADSSSSSGLGRPGTLINLRPSSCYVVGANVGAGRVGVVLADMMLNVVARKSFTFDFDAVGVDEIIAKTAKAINALIDKSGLPRQAIKGMGVGVPGKVDRAGRSNVSSKFTQWLHDIPFADQLEQLLDLPVVLEHNATAMALAEAFYGAGRGYGTVLHLYLRAGLGAGLVHARHGELVHPGPVEIGHIVIDPDGQPCQCGGRGCVETVFSEAALLRAMSLSQVPSTGLIAAAMDSPDVWEPAYARFLEALSTTVTLLGPDLILLGGHLGEAPAALLDALNADLPKRLMPQFRGVRVARATLQPDAGALGAACVGLEKFVFEG